MRFFVLLQRAIVLTLFLFMTTGCTSTSSKHESTGEYLDDSVLTTKVKATFLGDSRLKMLDISVETFKGVVQLSGFVDTKKEADRAVELARTISGVKAVNNSLIIK